MKSGPCHALKSQVTKWKFRQACHSVTWAMNRLKLYSILFYAILWEWVFTVVHYLLLFAYIACLIFFLKLRCEQSFQGPTVRQTPKPHHEIKMWQRPPTSVMNISGVWSKLTHLVLFTETPLYILAAAQPQRQNRFRSWHSREIKRFL
jgi:hypothetical protein